MIKTRLTHDEVQTRLEEDLGTLSHADDALFFFVYTHAHFFKRFLSNYFLLNRYEFIQRFVVRQLVEGLLAVFAHQSEFRVLKQINRPLVLSDGSRPRAVQINVYARSID
jgi:hypothetical protein